MRYLLKTYQRDIGGDVDIIPVSTSLVYPDGRSSASSGTDEELIPDFVYQLYFVPKQRSRRGFAGCDSMVTERRIRVNLSNRQIVTGTPNLSPVESVEFEFVFPFRSPNKSTWQQLVNHFDNVNANFWYLIGERQRNYAFIEAKLL